MIQRQLPVLDASINTKQTNKKNEKRSHLLSGNRKEIFSSLFRLQICEPHKQGLWTDHFTPRSLFTTQVEHRVKYLSEHHGIFLSTFGVTEALKHLTLNS